MENSLENVIIQFLKATEERLTDIEENLKDIKTHIEKIETNTRENTDVAQKMSRYTAVLDFAENKLTNSGLLSYFSNFSTIQDEINENDETEEPNSDFDE